MSNNSSSNSGANGGITFCGLLAIVFIVLKLMKIITWSWLWVLSPLWIPTVLVILVIVAMMLFFK